MEQIAASLLKNSPEGKRCPVTLKKTSEPKRKANLYQTYTCSDRSSKDVVK